MGDPHGGHNPAPAGAKASPVRLVVLLAILAILVGALGFDWFVAKPGVEAADRTLKSAAEKNNSVGFTKNVSAAERDKQLADSLLDSADVQRILNKSPAKTVKGDGYMIEVYRWWGYVPLSRHYMSVVYLGNEANFRYSTHYVNSPAPAESLPGYERPPLAYEEPEGVAKATAEGKTGTGGGPGGKGGGPGGKGGGPGGKGGKGGKGKGGKGDRPPTEGAAAGIATEEAPSETKAGAKEGDKPASETPTEEKTDADKPESKSGEKPATTKDEPQTKDGDKPAAEKKADEKKDDEKKTDE